MSDMATPETGALTMSDAAEGIAQLDGFADLLSDVEDDASLADEGGDEEEIADVADDATDDDETDITDDGGDADDAEPDEDSDEDGETVSFEAADELAEALGMSMDDLMELTFTFKAAGEEVTVTGAEMRAGYQKEADYRQKTAELAEATRTQERQHAERMAAAQQQAETAQGILRSVEQALLAGYDDASMAQLRVHDQDQWLVKMAERQRVTEFLGNLHQTAESQRQGMAQSAQQYMAEMQAREGAALREKLPDLDGKRLANWVATEFGYTPEEVASAADHRLFLMAERARAAEAELADLKSAASVAEKKVKKLPPKVAKPKKGRTNAQIRADKLKSVKARAAKSGKMRDAAVGIEAILGDDL